METQTCVLESGQRRGMNCESTDMHTLWCLQSLDSVWHFATPWAARSLCPLGFSWQEYRCGLPFAPPGDLPSLAIKPESLVSPALASRFFTTEPHGKPWHIYILPCVKQIASGKLDIWHRELSLVVSDDDLEGWDWRGKKDQEGADIYIYSYKWFLMLYSRDQHNIVKQLPSS